VVPPSNPELIGIDAVYRFYAKILKLDSDAVNVRSLEGGEGTVDRSVADHQVVLASEVTQMMRVMLFRRQTMKFTKDKWGALTAIVPQSRPVSNHFAVTVDAVSVVAPIVALRFEDVVFISHVRRPSEVEEIEQFMLDRVLGHGGATASNKIGGICEDLMRMQALFDPYAGDDNVPLDNVDGIHPAARAQITQAKCQRNRVASDHDTLIVASIGDGPNLLERFLTMRNEVNSKRQNEGSDEHGLSVELKFPKGGSCLEGQTNVENMRLFPGQIITSARESNLTKTSLKVWFGPSSWSSRIYPVFVRVSLTFASARHGWRQVDANFDKLTVTTEFSSASPPSRIDEVVVQFGRQVIDECYVFETASKSGRCSTRDRYYIVTTGESDRPGPQRHIERSNGIERRFGQITKTFCVMYLYRLTLPLGSHVNFACDTSLLWDAPRAATVVVQITTDISSQ
ncbi:Hypothetical protein PHPALM_20878, partial [Phytophthora palmivora]